MPVYNLDVKVTDVGGLSSTSVSESLAELLVCCCCVITCHLQEHICTDNYYCDDTFDVNEAPELADLNLNVNENTPKNGVVGGTTFAALDQDRPYQVLTYTITSDPVTQGGFIIDRVNSPNSGEPKVARLLVNEPAWLDFDDTPVLFSRITVTDDGTPSLSDTATATITVLDVNEVPVIAPASRSVDENSPVGTNVEHPFLQVILTMGNH